MTTTKSLPHPFLPTVGLVVGALFAIVGAYLYLWPAVQLTGQYLSSINAVADGYDSLGMNQFFVSEVVLNLPILWLKGLTAGLPGLALAIFSSKNL